MIEHLQTLKNLLKTKEELLARAQVFVTEDMKKLVENEDDKVYCDTVRYYMSVSLKVIADITPEVEALRAVVADLEARDAAERHKLLYREALSAPLMKKKVQADQQTDARGL